MHELAEVNVAYFLGGLAATAIFPVTGLILFIVGIRQQSRARQLPSADPPPSPNPPDPLSLPPDSPSPSQYDPSLYTPPRPSRWSVALIVMGALLLIFGLFKIVDDAADLVRQSRGTVRSPQTPNVGQCIAAANFREHTRNPKALDCSQSDAIFEVVTKGDPSSTCPDGKTETSDYAFLRDGSAATPRPVTRKDSCSPRQIVTGRRRGSRSPAESTAARTPHHARRAPGRSPTRIPRDCIASNHSATSGH